MKELASCHAHLLSMVRLSKLHIHQDHFEDQFEIPFEDSASRLLLSLTNALHSPRGGHTISPKGTRTEGLRVDLLHLRLPFGSRKGRRNAESATIRGGSNTSAVRAFTPAPTCQPHDPEFGVEHPSADQLLSHPLALLSYVPKNIALFVAGAVAGAAAKIVTAPLDRVKLLMQVHGVRAAQENASQKIGFLEATIRIGKEEGWKGYWKGNFPQVIRVIPYSAVQLFAYEIYKKVFTGKDKQLSVTGRLAAGACAGMTSTLVTYPLDVLRLRLAVDPACKSMIQVASCMMREEGVSSFYKGLGPSLLGIAPYIALNFCVFDLMKNSLSEDIRNKPSALFATAFLSASLATAMCYPLDTVRRQLQMKGTPYANIADAIPGIVAKDGFMGLYRGFVPNALKNLPNNSIRLTAFDAAKRLVNASQQEFQRLLRVRREQIVKAQL